MTKLQSFDESCKQSITVNMTDLFNNIIHLRYTVQKILVNSVFKRLELKRARRIMLLKTVAQN